MIANGYGVSLGKDEHILKLAGDDGKSLEGFNVISYLKSCPGLGIISQETDICNNKKITSIIPEISKSLELIQMIYDQFVLLNNLLRE